ncbi:branched-chain amino acid ABC transporter permease [Haloferax sp. YSMS24]|uniref:branched-chain amino acid ABC transporter permease n=1 Tax=Haloferax sp. YSMS24 TaxID=3388425 RepID=UPI00398CB8FE
MSSLVSDEQLQRIGWSAFAVFLVVGAALPLVVDDQFVLRLVMFAFIWSAFAVAWNLFSGYSGFISFGHAIFFGVGAFTSTWLQINMEIVPWIGMVVGAVFAVVIAVTIGYITFSAGLSGIYFALSMLTLPLIAAPVVTWLGYIELSIPIATDQPLINMSFLGIEGYYYISVGLFLLTFGVAWWVQRNRLGYYLQAIKSSEEGAASLGVNTTRYKILALSLSAFLSALIGTVYVQANFIFATNDIFTLTTSAQPVILAVAGGLGTLFGPVVAGFTLFPIAELLREELGSIIPGINGIVYGFVLIFIIIYLPDGIYAGARNRLFSNRTSRNVETGSAKGTTGRDEPMKSDTKEGSD